MIRADLVASGWDCFGGPVVVTPVGGRVGRAEAPAGCFYVKGPYPLAQLRRQIELLRFLSGRDVPVPEVVPARDGEAWAGDPEALFWLSRALPGEHFEQFRDASGLEEVACLASALAQLHRALADAPNASDFPVFFGSHSASARRLLERETPFDTSRLEALVERLEPLPELPSGLLHRDPHRRNVLFCDRALSGFLDFELVVQGPRLFDVCYCASGVLSESFPEPGYADYWLQVLERVFRAYTREGELLDVERSAVWSMLATIQLIFMNFCLDGGNREAALMNEQMLYWCDARRARIEWAVGCP